jgi:hypothetical protein
VSARRGCWAGPKRSRLGLGGAASATCSKSVPAPSARRSGTAWATTAALDGAGAGDDVIQRWRAGDFGYALDRSFLEKIVAVRLSCLQAPRPGGLGPNGRVSHEPRYRGLARWEVVHAIPPLINLLAADIGPNCHRRPKVRRAVRLCVLARSGRQFDPRTVRQAPMSMLVLEHFAVTRIHNLSL